MIRNTHAHLNAPLSAISQAGWADYRAGLTPYPPNYDRLPPSQQRNYERGRLRAANATLAFGRIPPKQTSALIQHARTLVGKF